ncbi:DUF1987 domain-containing protein [Desulfococcaceae bacterium HSG8]|nr:DUF1987 domain-containing protein [Desulfococcaceae bacterium HSG8]
MENLILEPTDKTLKINFEAEKGFLEMEGVSYPERTWHFFQTLNAWLKSYISEIGKPVTLDLKLQYLNSTSTKYLMDFLEILEEFYARGGKVRVNWYYEKGDDMEEMGNEFAEDIDLPLELILYN